MPSTPTKGGAIATAPVASKESGEINIGQGKATRTRIEHGLHAHLLAMLPVEGSLTTDGFIIESASLKKEGDKGTLVITERPFSAPGWPGNGGTSLPPDSWDLTPSTSDVPIENHPEWEALSAPHKTWWKIALGEIMDARISATWARNWIEAYGTADLKAMFAIKQSTGTFPVTYWTYTWQRYSTNVPGLSDGNVIETPSGPGLPYLGGGLTWKRQPDRFSAPGNGLYLTVREWVGVPTALGGWNTWLFS